MPQKWNIDATPSEKMLALYTMLLFSGREASLTELSRSLNCSKQVIMRLIDQLEASRFGKLLRSKRGREAVYQLDRPKTLPKISLNAEGFYQLALCRDFMLHLLPESMRKKVETTLQQASAFISEDDGNDLVDSLGQAFVKGRIDYTPFQMMLQSLIQATRERKTCMVRYKSALHKEEREFEYAPKRLIVFHDAFYITGWDITDKGIVRAAHETPTILALHRLKEVTLTRRSCKLLPEPLEEGQNAFGFISGETFSACIRFNKSAATYVAEREWSAGQQIFLYEGGDIALTLTSRSPAELVSWILSFGDAAQVISPKWLRKEVSSKVHLLSAYYAEKDE
jgi:predicted DNA-binding transcriptional regulator YafY